MVPTVVLVVDDEVAYVDTLLKRLMKRKLLAEGAYSGSEALKRLTHNPYVDVVILDLKMPGMDGLETLKQIKAVRPLVEVIMLTGHATVPDAVRGMKLGAFDYMMKPSDLSELLDKLEEAKIRKREQEEKILEAKARSIIARRGY